MLGVYMQPMNTINGHIGPHAFVNMRGQLASSHNLTSQTHRLWDATTVTLPYWLKLERVGNRITAFHPTDGASWSTIRSADIALGDAAYMGIAVSSRVNGKLKRRRLGRTSSLRVTTLQSSQRASWLVSGTLQFFLRWRAAIAALRPRWRRRSLGDRFGAAKVAP
jgi:hypothetical protein